MATKVIVQLSDGRSYPVRIGSGVMDALGRNLRALEHFQDVRDVLVLTDSNVGPLYAARAKGSLAQAGFSVSDIVVPAGEESKSLEVAGEIWSAMAQLGLGRDCLVVALGGGVVGDLAGFVASTYMRGVPYVQVPTTVLAMVDSSVGGKTAVNLQEGKNLVGSFHQPAFVCADTDALNTLPDREWLCGFGELAKSAIIDSDDFFFWLCDHVSALVAHEPETVAEAIARCVVFKADVVARDETESNGQRACLNYGHTLGHAIESCAGFGAYSHGACVAEGIRFAAYAAATFADRLGTTRGNLEEFASAQCDVLDMLGLAPLDYSASPEDLLAAMKRDKKVRNGEVRFVLAEDIAQWRIIGLSDADILACLAAYRS